MEDISQSTQDAPNLPPNDDDDAVGAWAKLVLISAPFTTHYLKQNEIKIGRKSACQIQVNHPAVSGFHCTLILRDKGREAYLVDSSTNGTYVNSHEVTKGTGTPVYDGAEIVLIRSALETVAFRLWFITNNKPEELNAFESKYSFAAGEPLGSGAFALVRKCYLRSTGDAYACKVIDKKKFQQLSATKRDAALLDECKILQMLSHPHIIKYVDCIDTAKTLYLVLELVTGGDLFDRIVSREGKGFSESESKQVFLQILDAVKYLHANKIVHRDLKPENILLSDNETLNVRISDFGLSRIMHNVSKVTTFCGTPQYLAPEIALPGELSDPSNLGYTAAVDIWSMGCLLYILVSGLAPFPSPNPQDPGHLYRLIKGGEYIFPPQAFSKVSPEAIDMIKRMLTVDPAKRITLAQLERHPWLCPPSAATTPTKQTSGVKRKSSGSESKDKESAEKKRQVIEKPQATSYK